MLKDTALAEAQAHAEREHMVLEDAHVRLAQAEKKAQEAEGLATAPKENGNALVVVEGQLREERTAREGAQSQLVLREAALTGRKLNSNGGTRRSRRRGPNYPKPWRRSGTSSRRVPLSRRLSLSSSLRVKSLEG